MVKIVWWLVLVFVIWIGLRTAVAAPVVEYSFVPSLKQAPFVILYPSGQEAWIHILANVIESLPLYQEAGNRTFSSLIWLYSHTETANKHIPGHWEAMWDFKCGRTAGRWPWCGGHSNKVDLDPQDPTSAERREWTQGHLVYGLKHSKPVPENHPVHRHQRPRPLTCGFAISMNIVTPDLMDYFVKRKVRVMMLTPGNPVLSVMLMLSADINSQQQQQQQLKHIGFKAYRKRKQKIILHQLYCSGGGQSLIKLILKQQSEMEQADQLISGLREYELPVFVQDGPEFFLVPQVSLGSMYEFVLDKFMAAVAEGGHLSLSQMRSLVVSPEIQQEIHLMVTPNPQVLLDCRASLEDVKLFFVLTAGSHSKDMVETLTELLSLIDLIEKLPAEKVSRIWKTRSDILTLESLVASSEEDGVLMMNTNKDTWAKGKKRRRQHRA